MTLTVGRKADAVATAHRDDSSFAITNVPVSRIRPEDGLARKRDREGHRELQRSIAQFGVLTPVSLRPAPDGSGDYLLIKGQGRTLACRILGIEMIPAVVVDALFAEDEKVQQFLVENVARLKMRPVDRALLVHRARQNGEETVGIAKRFGLSPATVRRLLSQMENVSQSEVAALRSGDVNLAMHSVISRYVDVGERSDVLAIIAGSSLKAKDIEALFIAIGWKALSSLGQEQHSHRLSLLSWACRTFDQSQSSSTKDKLRQIAVELPLDLENLVGNASVALR